MKNIPTTDRILIGIIAILLIVATYLNASAQKVDDTEPTKETTTTVLKVDSTEREKIERWTREHTFPDIIVFIEDSLGNYIVGKEVLSDPAYEKIITTNEVTREKEAVRSYITKETEVIEYKPKPEEEIKDSEPGTKEPTEGTK